MNKVLGVFKINISYENMEKLHDYITKNLSKDYPDFKLNPISKDTKRLEFLSTACEYVNGVPKLHGFDKKFGEGNVIICDENIDEIIQFLIVKNAGVWFKDFTSIEKNRYSEKDKAYLVNYNDLLFGIADKESYSVLIYELDF